jgi:catechol 2,3-dioxygenase-like lactoylglutathione lyase family enzyme
MRLSHDVRRCRQVDAETHLPQDSGTVAAMKSVAHTGITVRDLEASIAFWRDVLGFEVQERMELSGEFAEQITGVADAHLLLAQLAGGGHRIELLQYLRPTNRAHVCPRPCDVGSFHVAVNVDDLDAVSDVCAQHGWRLAGRPQRGVEGRLAGSRFAYMRDGDGTTVELIQN